MIEALFNKHVQLHDYHIRRCLVATKQQSPKFMRETKNDDFLLFKILQNFTTFLPKEQKEGCLIIKASYL